MSCPRLALVSALRLTWHVPSACPLWQECASNPCRNGGTCQDNVNSWTCTCPAGYSGDYCTTNINECASSPCRNGGTCVDAVASFSCTCRPGYTGRFCETDVNGTMTPLFRRAPHPRPCLNSLRLCAASPLAECASSPCRTPGTANCVDGLDSYTCICNPGYTGRFCETNVNECASSACRSPGTSTCVDGIDSFTCLCNAGYTGRFCETNVNGPSLAAAGLWLALRSPSVVCRTPPFSP
jgi:hypothetical protein